MSTLLTRLFARPRAFCVDCQASQGRNCACRKPRPRREMTSAEWWWLILVLLSGFWGLVGWAWRAWA